MKADYSQCKLCVLSVSLFTANGGSENACLIHIVHMGEQVALARFGYK